MLFFQKIKEIFKRRHPTPEPVRRVVVPYDDHRLHVSLHSLYARQYHCYYDDLPVTEIKKPKRLLRRE